MDHFFFSSRVKLPGQLSTQSASSFVGLSTFDANPFDFWHSEIGRLTDYLFESPGWSISKEEFMRSFLLVTMALSPALLRAFTPLHQRRSVVSTARFAEAQTKIPMTLLSGFLGSGKVGLRSSGITACVAHAPFTTTIGVQI